MKRFLFSTLLIFTLSFLVPNLFQGSHIAAQCSMCQATAESSRDAGSTNSDGINKGVMYLFFTPYLIIGTVAYFWWRARKKARQ